MIEDRASIAARARARRWFPAGPPLGQILAYLALLGYAIVYLVVAFTDGATSWWWWFIPISGTIQIFQESVGLGLVHVGILSAAFAAATIIAAAEASNARPGGR